jgi:hypothetical protein
MEDAICADAPNVATADARLRSMRGARRLAIANAAALRYRSFKVVYTACTLNCFNPDFLTFVSTLHIQSEIQGHF